MGFLDRFRRNTVDLEERSPELGLKFKDLLVLEQLVKAGADLTNPRHVVYYLYFEAEGAATTAASEAQAKGFTTRCSAPDPSSAQWSVISELHDHVLSADDVVENTDFFEAVALRHGGEFDGWEASVN